MRDEIRPCVVPGTATLKQFIHGQVLTLNLRVVP